MRMAKLSSKSIERPLPSILFISLFVSSFLAPLGRCLNLTTEHSSRNSSCTDTNFSEVLVQVVRFTNLLRE